MLNAFDTYIKEDLKLASQIDDIQFYRVFYKDNNETKHVGAMYKVFNKVTKKYEIICKDKDPQNRTMYKLYESLFEKQ